MVAATIEWFGTTTFRVHTGGPVLFFDAYLDRVPGLDPVGLSTAEVDAADFVFVSHAHFDHLFGADAIALRTGATVVGSPEVGRCLRACGVPEEQLLIVTGGETVDCGGGVRARVLPALHSCLFAHGESDTALPCLGDLGISAQERIAARQVFFDLMAGLKGPQGEALQAMNAKCSAHDGGQLSYLLLTGEGSALVSASAGYWKGLFDGLRPDVALLAIGGRPNVDGEPFQGSGAAIHARAGGAAAARAGGLLPSRPALSRPALGRHRRGRRGAGRVGRAHRLFLLRVRHAEAAVRLRLLFGRGRSWVLRPRSAEAAVRLRPLFG